jgi:hypothetical protein
VKVSKRGGRAVKTVKNVFKSLDIFKQNISLTYKGENSFPTCYGALVSFFVISTVIVFASIKGAKFFTLDDPETTRSLHTRNL